MLTPDAAQRVYKVLVYVADCPDGVDSNERAVLDAFAASQALSATDVARLEQEGKEKAALERAQSEAEQEAMTKGMIEVIAADGVLDHHEQERLLTLAEDLAIPKEAMKASLLDRLMGG